MADTNKQMGDEKMKSFTMRMPKNLILEAQHKAGMIPLSKIIRRLVEKWIKGEIIIE